MYRLYRPIKKGEFILVAVDTSSGGLDYTAGQFLSKTRLDVPLVYHSKTTTSDYIPLLARTLEKIYDITGIKPVVAIERQNGGSFLADRLAGLNYLGKYTVFVMPNFGVVDPSEGVRLGWDTNSATRPKMLQDLKDAANRGVFTIYDRKTIMEMLSFIIVQTSSSWKAQAEKKAHDDLVMALAIAWQLYQLCEPPSAPVNDARQTLAELPKDNLFDKSGFY
jgi:hypothetical protein